jgi:2-oxoglutarate dehydrogenase E1 component
MVTECLNMSQLEGYTAGGTVHSVINNLIGFTTVPEDGRSTRYCTDVAKMIEAPIFHVNGEDPEAVITVAILAVRYRQVFKRDVFVDLLCYRKYGHNEQDEQSFTQPILAALIEKQPSIFKSYSQRLVTEGVITEAELKALTDRLDAALEAAQAKAKRSPHDPTIDPAGARWRGMDSTYSFDPVKTGASRDQIAEVCAALGRVPDGFNVNPKLARLLQSRAGLAKADPKALVLNHADAELLAFGTLLLDATPVRLSGQDSRRGTFTQRHSVLRDAKSGEPHTPLNAMREMGEPGIPDREPGTTGADGRPRQAKFCVYDSPLSEVSVMGFDYGYSLADPIMLVCWEAQFGDFVNGAQVIIDQYLASSELKWDRWSGLVLLLPHGYEGAGPEHSSCRMERFLQLCADDNLQVVYPSTAAQHFHMLRRQVRRNFRKPLVVMTPKGMLREPTSSMAELSDGRFFDLIDDPAFTSADRKAVKRVIYCSGKIYHELAKRREAISRADTAIVRIEQLYPLNVDLLREIDARYPKGAERVWVQEEPRNAGAYIYIADRFQTDLKLALPYIGREPSASPAVGSKHVHKDQQEEILTAAIGPAPAPAAKASEVQPKPTDAKAPDKAPDKAKLRATA